MCPRQLAQVHCILLRVSWSPRVPPRPPPTPTCCWHSAPTSPVSIIGINCIDSPTSSAGATTRLPLGENNGKVVSTTSSLPAINRHWRHNLKLFLTFFFMRPEKTVMPSQFENIAQSWRSSQSIWSVLLCLFQCYAGSLTAAFVNLFNQINQTR